MEEEFRVFKTVPALIALCSCLLFVQRANGSPDVCQVISQQLKITAAVRCDSPPACFFDMKSNRPAGFFVDMMDKIAGRAGLRVDYICGHGWTDIINKIESGEADVGVMPMNGENGKGENEEALMFTAPVNVSYRSFFARAKNGMDISRVPEGKTVGVVKGSVSYNELESKDYPGARLVVYDGYEQAFFGLFASQVDLLAGPEYSIRRVAALAGLDGQIRRIKPFSEARTGIAVRKGNFPLLNRLNSALEGFVGGPEYRDVYARWYGDPSPVWTLGRIAVTGSVLLFLTVSAMSLWRHRSVQRLHRQLQDNRAERERMEEDMRLQADIYYDVAEGIVLSRFEDGTIAFSNPNFDKMFGYGEGELAGRHISMIKAPYSGKGPEGEGEAWRRMKESGAWHGEFLAARKDGTPFWCNASVSEHNHSVHGRIWVATYRDITERKEMMKALQRSEKELKDITSSLAEGIYVMNDTGQFIFMNSEAERILGWTMEDLSGKNVHDLVHSSRVDGTHLPLEECPIYKVVKTGMRFASDDEFFIRKDGTIFPVSLLSSPLMENGKVVASVTAFRDITDHKRLQREVAEISTKERCEIGYELHDGIGQILAGISFLCKAMEKKLGDGQGAAFKDLQMIKERIGEAQKKVRDISRVLSTCEVEGSGIATALRQVAGKIESIYNVKCGIDFSCDASIENNMIAEQLYLIAVEAMTNAAKHSGAKNIFVTLLNKGGKIRLAVEDDGRGFDQGVGQGGHGMGLQIMKHRAGIIGARLRMARGGKGGAMVECTLSGEKTGVV